MSKPHPRTVLSAPLMEAPRHQHSLGSDLNAARLRTRGLLSLENDA